MKTLDLSTASEYRCRVNLDLYSSPLCEGLATQAAANRHLRLESIAPTEQALLVRSCEDDYPAWLKLEDVARLELTTDIYQAVTLDRSAIVAKIPKVIAFTQAAMQVPNRYLWGGTVAPNYDCSGLVQAAFSSVGIWLPRDSYQQEAFVEQISIDDMLPGDLIFFGTSAKTDHVALYLGDLKYIHSSGIQMGRNGIGIDILTDLTEDPVSCGYYSKLRCCGRVMRSYISGSG
ncbi:C40 family peptidase [Chamaesiphon minutus]|uniref:Cell wall-associated hydrolase, invasion-associated protein n=1 Tax=Chamaesiphon minutus (strain ATCC 27169 / PCC 6605) TaxID=1173020 RepID=K9UPW7_CHAP6|nr:C40 family peptidase [Chamaesiphon minutus]AFY96244.1 cell wall-associated hydrolase, invasion-associated protein [Chamaesiphon minutus PCC 6605]